MQLSSNHFVSSRSRKLNPQLEQAIQEAMSELDSNVSSPPCSKMKTTRNSSVKKRSKPVKIAPAPPQISHNVKYLRNHNNNNISKWFVEYVFLIRLSWKQCWLPLYNIYMNEIKQNINSMLRFKKSIRWIEINAPPKFNCR